MDPPMRRHLLTVVLAVFCTDPAAALDLPARKPGLWEITMISEYTQRAQVMQQCVDAATDELLQERFTVGELSCPKVDIQRSGSTTIVESSCTVGDTAKATHAVFEGDFDSAYAVTVTRSGGSLSMQGAYRRTMTQQAKWLGACIASQKPGDADWVRD
jgi:uncharacterized protein DUF3617